MMIPDYEDGLAEWGRRCMGGAFGWRVCAAAFVLAVLWVLVR